MRISELETYKDPKYHWDKRAYLRVKSFFEKWLVHSEGEFAGQPFILLPWQDEFIANVFGLIETATGLRRYRSAAIWIAKGGGKTAFAAGLALLGIVVDEEPSSECYVAAKSKDQAESCYNKARSFINNCPRLKDKFEESYGELVCSKTVLNKLTGKTFEDVSHFGAVSSEGKNFHGKSPHIVVLDELWNQSDSVLYSALSKSRRSRRQPLLITISTAGERRNEFAYGRWCYDKKIFANPALDESHYVVIYAAEDGDDWNDEATWLKANPSLGITPKLDILRDEYKKAKDDPMMEKDFKQFHLNLWVSSTTAWINQGRWDANTEPFSDDSLVGLPCNLGCDLSLTTDLTALTLTFKKENKFYRIDRLFMPIELIQTRSFIDQVPYDKWAADGWIVPCGTTEINQREIEAEIMALYAKYNFAKALFDPALAANLMVRLETQLPYVGKFQQTYTGFSKAAPFFNKLISEGRLIHQGNPAVNWMAYNVEVSQSGNFVKPCKPQGVRGRNIRIDAIVSGIMSLAPFREIADYETEAIDDVGGMVWKM